MTQPNEHSVELSIPSILGYEKVAMATAAVLGQELGFSQARIDDLRTAVSEACLNAIEHGNNQDASVQVQVKFTTRSSGLQVEVRDRGRGIIERPSPPRIKDKMAGKGTFRGWGLFLIERLVDEVAFEPQPEDGHIVRLTMYCET